MKITFVQPRYCLDAELGGGGMGGKTDDQSKMMRRFNRALEIYHLFQK